MKSETNLDTLQNVQEASGDESNGIRMQSIHNNRNNNRKRYLELVPVVRPVKLRYVPLKTGVCFDVRMRYHSKLYTSYFEYIDPHPEDPRRIYRIYKILCENGLIDDPSLSIASNSEIEATEEPKNINGKESSSEINVKKENSSSTFDSNNTNSNGLGEYMVKIPIKKASIEEILLVHSKEHLAFIEKTEKMSRQDLLKETETGDSVYFNNESFLSARLSCGGAIEACKSVVEGKVKNALAIVRPPGHHAEPERPGGFCLFSNVAIAAKSILKNYSESVKKIMILDWDIHHGNGTQKSFYNSDQVLYVSLHRFELGKYYPGTKIGDLDQCGEDKGEGFNCNIPWPIGGVGDADYMLAFRKVIMPMAQEFKPDLVIISAGFDAAEGDTIGQCHVTPACYGQMTHMLKSLARGNLVVVLEGGYNLDSIAISALDVAKVLIGEPPNEIENIDPKTGEIVVPKPEAIKTVENVIKQQSKYWQCFKTPEGNQGLPLAFWAPPTPNNEQKKTASPPSETSASKNESKQNSPLSSDTPAISMLPPSIVPLNKSLDNYRFQYLQEMYTFYPLPLIHNPIISEIKAQMENFIIGTTFNPAQHLTDTQNLVVLIHDTPEMWGKPNPITGVLDPSQTYLIDTTLKIIEWCERQKYAVIDITIPTNSQNTVFYSQEVMMYLWDNYLQYFNNMQKIAFIGIGDSTAGLVHLLGHRDTREYTKCCISFVDKTSLKSIVPLIDQSLVDWYYKNSLVFASKNHTCWSSNTKPRKKYGRVLKCLKDGMCDIFDEKFEEATDFILDSFEEFDDDDEDGEDEESST